MADFKTGQTITIKVAKQITRDGRTLWDAIARSARNAICDPESDVRKRLGAAPASAGAGSVVAAVIAALGLPLVAAPLAAALAAVILAIGVDGFCSWTAAPPDAS